MTYRYFFVTLTALIITASHSGASAADSSFSVKVVDRIEYNGLTTTFCKAVGEKSYLMKGQKVPVFKTQDAITAEIDTIQSLQPLQQHVAKRIATVLVARIYAEVPYQAKDPEMMMIIQRLSESECIQGNNLIQGMTALNVLTAKK